MRFASLFGALGVAACLAAFVPVTAEANSTSPYQRMDRIEHRGMMTNSRMTMHSHRMHHHHRMMR